LWFSSRSQSRSAGFVHHRGDEVLQFRSGLEPLALEPKGTLRSGTPMIAIPGNVRVWLATGHTDMWRGFPVASELGVQPCCRCTI
jgi:hypothetical protein